MSAISIAMLLLSTPHVSAQDSIAETSENVPAATPTAVKADASDGWPDLIPTSAFAGRTSLQSAQLSPDGSRLAFQTSRNSRALIAIFDAETHELVGSIDVGQASALEWFRWAGNDRILFSLKGGNFKKSRRRLRAYDYAPATQLMVHHVLTDQSYFVGFEEQGLEGDDVLYVAPDGAYILLSLSQKRDADPDVYRFPLDGSKGDDAASIVQKKHKGIDEWWADNHGVVRLGLRWRGRPNFAFFYRGSATEALFEVANVDKDQAAEVDKWDVLSIRAGTDSGFALIGDAGGKKVLREFDYRSGTAGKIIYEHDTQDVDGIRVDSTGGLLAVSFVDHAPQVEWVDSEFKDAQSKLEAALGKGRVRILSIADQSRMLVWHGAATDPGAMYVYTPQSRELDLFSEFRPDIDFRQLAEVKIASYEARDGTPIEAYLTLPRVAQKGGFPLIILPHGGPYGVRDLHTYNDEVQMLANRGYAVLQPNFRGSGGYGMRFEELGDGQIGRKMQDDLDDAMDWAVKNGHADPDRVCVVGGSYGGYAALWAVIRNPERYRCAASWAGVTDFREQLNYDKDYLDRRVGKRWRSRVSGDRRLADLDAISPAKQIARLKRPVLIAHGMRDGRVPFNQFLMFKEAAEANNIPIEPLAIENEGHSFSGKHNEQKWYDALIKFLAKHNPSDRPLPPPEKDDGPKGIKRVNSM